MIRLKRFLTALLCTYAISASTLLYADDSDNEFANEFDSQEFTHTEQGIWNKNIEDIVKEAPKNTRASWRPALGLATHYKYGLDHWSLRTLSRPSLTCYHPLNSRSAVSITGSLNGPNTRFLQFYQIKARHYRGFRCETLGEINIAFNAFLDVKSPVNLSFGYGILKLGKTSFWRDNDPGSKLYTCREDISPNMAQRVFISIMPIYSLSKTLAHGITFTFSASSADIENDKIVNSLLSPRVLVQPRRLLTFLHYKRMKYFSSKLMRVTQLHVEFRIGYCIFASWDI